MVMIMGAEDEGGGGGEVCLIEGEGTGRRK